MKSSGQAKGFVEMEGLFAGKRIPLGADLFQSLSAVVFAQVSID